MKQLIQTILITLLLVFCAMPVYAADYTIDELQMELTVPDDWFTFTRDTHPGDEYLDKLYMDFDTLLEFFTSNDIFLLSYLDDKSAMMLTVSADQNSRTYYSMTDDSDDDLKEMAFQMTEKNIYNDYTEWDVYTSENLSIL